MIVLLSLLFQIVFNKNNKHLYERLQVKHSDSEEEITANYHRIIHQLKQTRGNSYQFDQVERAYNILKDRTKRSIYDLDGEDEVQRYEAAVRGGFADKRYRKLPSKKIELETSFKDSYLGTEKLVTFSRQSHCRFCQATGAMNGHLQKCNSCQGTGVVIQTMNISGMAFQMQQTCPVCQGKGSHSHQPCNVCRGTKIIHENKTLKVQIPKGVLDNQEIVYQGEGDMSATSIPSDLILKIRVKNDTDFSREGNYLVKDLSISFGEALFGFQRRIQLLNEEMIPLDKIGVSQFQEEVLINGKGFQHENTVGNLLLRIQFKLPQELTKEQRKIIETTL